MHGCLVAPSRKRGPVVLILSLLMQTSVSQVPYRAVLFNGATSSRETKIAALTLAGIVNRDSARLYLLNVYETWSYPLTDERWADIYCTHAHVVFDTISAITTLVDRFRTSLQGGISYDPGRYFSNFPGQQFQWQAEYAALIGGLAQRLPVTPQFAQLLNVPLSDSLLVTDSFDGDPPVWVPGRLDLPSLPWNNSALTEESRYLTMLDWGVRTLLPLCNPQKLYIREITDFTVSKRMFQVNLAGTDDLDLNSMPSPRADILERVLVFLHGKNPNSVFHIYGWMYPEPMTQWLAFFGSSFHETLLANLSWHSSFPVPTRQHARASTVSPDTVRLQNKHYVLFVGSEGDASNWVFSFQSGAWLSPQRGTVPIGWGWNLHLLHECPFVAAYYTATATPNDGFISVTSPLGYAYPDLWRNDVWNGARDSSRALMDKFSVSDIYGYKHYAGTGTMVYRGKTINNSFDFPRYGAFQSAIQAHLTILYDPLLNSQIPITTYGSLLFNHVGDGSFYGDASNLVAMANRITTRLRSQPLPSFLLAGYQRFRQDEFSARAAPSDADMSVPRLAQLVQMIRADTVVGRDVEVVTPEKFSVLMRKATGILGVSAVQNPPSRIILFQNYPNPFNPTTALSYELPGPSGVEAPEVSDVKLAVYDILGREVAILVDERKAPGSYTVRFDASGLAGGVYFYQLVVTHGAHRSVQTRKLAIIK